MTWLRYLELYRRFYLTLIVCAVASAGQSFILLPVVLLVRRAFDEAIPAKNLYLLVIIGFSIFLANVASEAVIVITRYRILKITKLVTQRLRHDLLDRIFTLPRFTTPKPKRGGYTRASFKHRNALMSQVVLSSLSWLPALFATCVLMGILVFLDWTLFLAVISLFSDPLGLK